MPGTYQGRVLEIITNNKELKNSNGLIILVLVEDKIYSLRLEKKIKICSGAFISFNIDENFLVKDIKIKQIPNNFSPNGDVVRWRRPSKSPSRMELIRLRHELMYRVREWFYKKKFIETETPFLVRAPSPESQITPIKTDSGFLITSPEFQMKRLLVGGFERIFQVARCFRGNEIGTHHNPEFSMLEWYRSGEDLETLTNDIEQLVFYLIEKTDERGTFKHIPSPPWPRVKVRDLFKKHLGIILDGYETAEQLIEKARSSENLDLLKNFTVSLKDTNSIDYEKIFHLLWQKIENRTSNEIPLFVYEWPLNLPSLARPLFKGSGFVDRVELFVNGIELANGFEELTDSAEQRKRFEVDLKNRAKLGLESVPLDEKFLCSLEQGLPKCSGMALGLDRLIMWMYSANHIRQVLCFSDDEV